MIDKVQRTIPVTYLLNDYRGKFIAEAFYEHELYSSGCVSRGKSTSRERR